MAIIIYFCNRILYQPIPMNSVIKIFLSFCKPCAAAIVASGFAVSAAEPLPFTETFDSAEGFARFFVNNANNDSYTW